MVAEAFEGSFDIASISEILITLIPKVKAPSVISESQPISICNIFFKIITKVNTNRLKPITDKLVGGKQTSFVPARNITDKIMLYWLRKLSIRLELVVLVKDL